MPRGTACSTRAPALLRSTRCADIPATYAGSGRSSVPRRARLFSEYPLLVTDSPPALLS
jgi:hypothetical protein